MTNETQLALAAGLPMPHDPMFGQQGNHSHKATGLKRIHRLLRGRYPLVITLGLLFGVAGSLMGYLSQKPLFSSVSKIEIDPTVRSNSPSNLGYGIPEYQYFLASQVSVIESPELIQRALDEDEWKAGGGPRGDDLAMVRFASGLEVENTPNTAIIKISYSDPDAKLALAGAQAVTKAYDEIYQESDPMGFASRLRELDKEKSTYNANLLGYQQQLSDLQQMYTADGLRMYSTDDMAALQSEAQMELTQLNFELAQEKSRLESDERATTPIADSSGAGNSMGKEPPLTEEQIASNDEGRLNKMLAGRDAISQQIDRLQADGYGDENPTMKYQRSEYQVWDNAIKQYEQSVNDGGHVYANGRMSILPLKAEIASLKVQIDAQQKRYDEQNDLCAKIEKYAQSVKDIKKNITNAEGEIDRINNESEQLQTMANLNPTNQMRVVYRPTLASEPSTDRRKIMGALGFLGGALLPTLVVMLVSVLDGRFRYSDEANTDLGGIPLLGILPNLPDLLTDPTQAATAAHCVHQIRTILQITGASTERRVFAVTSGSPGDGKTSLTLALGLSFAASGSRTLLVDGDLVGGGLTARLNVNAEHGVLEAMASRDIMPFIRTTDVADLSFLPIGKALGGYTGTISPAAVRRLVDEARKHFDVILIDTGPILGSIEASPVAVASDGVVLCVSRGQQRQLVDRALAHLHAIGAKLAGVVFNRAQAQDFERSTNRMLGSVPAGTDGRRSEAIGPVARAVASSVRSASSGQEH
jgi:capsular exopolysaccharide synthesis family protein